MSDPQLSPETIAISAGRPPVTKDGSLNPDISLSSTYHAGGELGYGRSGNETWSALESAISELEGGQTLAFASGNAAISAVFALLPIGAPVVASDQGYSGTMAMLTSFQESGRLEVRFVDIANTDAVIAAMNGAAFLWLESPTNPGLEVADMPTLIVAARNLSVGVGVDNTFATPLIQNPLAMGADIVMHSVTKYFAGHSEGSLIGMVAAQSVHAAGYISISGAAQSIDVIINEQEKTQPEKIRGEMKTIMEQLHQKKLVDSVPKYLYSLFRPSVQPYMISWLQYNPSLEIKKLTIPVLIIQGTCDVQVKTEQATQLHKANAKSEIKVIDFMTHTLKITTKKATLNRKNKAIEVINGIINEDLSQDQILSQLKLMNSEMSSIEKFKLKRLMCSILTLTMDCPEERFNETG